MPSTSPPRGPDTPAGSPLRDEAELERLFRARYAALAEDAKHHLNDAESAAPHVVETLFLRAWNDRDRFRSAKELDDFLQTQLPHVAARELARRASAHHFGTSHTAHAATHAEHTADVNEAWERVRRGLHPDRAVTGDASQTASRHDAAAHVKDLGKKRSYTVPIIIGVVAIAAVLGAFKYLNLLGREGGVVQALAANSKNASQTQDGQTARAPLLDGSVVKLGPDSKLTVADNFGDDMRVIAIEGAAAVTVSTGHPVPLEMRAFNAVVHAHGGTVLIRTYAADSSVTVVALDASDSLRVGKDVRALTGGGAVHVAHDGQVRDASPGELAEASTWVNDTLSIADRTLKTAIDEIKTWYGPKIVVLDTMLLSRPVTAAAPLNSSLAAIAAVEQAAQVKFGYEGQAMVFRDAPKKK